MIFGCELFRKGHRLFCLSNSDYIEPITAFELILILYHDHIVYYINKFYFNQTKTSTVFISKRAQGAWVHHFRWALICFNICFKD